MSEIEICSPTAICRTPVRFSRRTLDGLKGRVIGFIDNAKPNIDDLVDDLGEILVNKYGAAAVIKRRKRGASIPAPTALIAELSEQCDLVITGSGE